ncbi:MAG: 6-pyruvoyl tetrahydrobiopterin synthase [Chloroflexi bacterium]|jgi:6-pyruvoyltetrahydropterin/6-carboxytetrahydropterin synthase|nr:6-pyruvoyl tetrahydrobiopterin synthase [Chloroflexota bacterium]
MSSNYRVRVYKEAFDFSAGHFITYKGECETIHGHNYRVEVQIGGDNGPDRFVYNFSDLKPVVKEECSFLDHRMLLAMKNPLIQYQQTEDEVVVRFEKRRYIFPIEEVALLPVENTTAEELAAYLVGRIRGRLVDQRRPELPNLHFLEVGVEEQPGQMAYYSEEW